VAGRDITEGRASRAIAVDVGVLTDTSVWVNTDIAYDVAIGDNHLSMQSAIAVPT